MVKLKLYPSSGTIEDARNLKFEISGIDLDSFRVSMENATHGTKIDVKPLQNMGDGQYMGIMDVKIPNHLSPSAISIFAHIEEKQEETYRTVQICPTIFTIKNEVNNDTDRLFITPSFIGVDDLCSIRMRGDPNSKKIVSVNDKFFRTNINRDGIGSVSFKGSDVISDNNIDSVYQLPIFIYNEEDNFTKKVFSDSYLNILPSSIAMYATSIDPRCDPDNENYIISGAWVQPDPCVTNVEPPEDDPPKPTIPPNALPIICREGMVEISSGSICKLFNMSSTLLNNGMIFHTYISPDINYNDSNDSRFNINKVFIAKQKTTLDVQVITNKDVVIAPKASGGLFLIYVEFDVWDALSGVSGSGDVYVVLFNNTIGFQRIQIVDRTIDEYTGNYVLVGEMEEDELSISDWLFCVNAVFYHASETPDLYIDILDYNSLPYITDADGNYLQILNTSVSSNFRYVGNDEESYIYVIAEALRDNNSQLFFTSLTVGKDETINRENTSWIQITSDGNNQNPVTKIGADNNIHVVWESDRADIKQLYYGVIGLSFISSSGTAFSSCIDKYSEFLSKNNYPFDYFSANLLVPIDSSKYDPSTSIPEYESEDLFPSGVWDIYAKKGLVSQSSANSFINDLNIVANALTEDAMAFNSLQIVEDTEEYDDFPYSQFNYQISFDLIATATQDSYLAVEYEGVVIDNKEIDNLFDEWKGEFESTTDDGVENQTVYAKGNNKFVIGRIDNIFDRIVPMVGSYKYDTSNPSFDFFQIDITNQSNNLKDFTFGLMFEKTKFIATNIVSSSEYVENNPSFSSYIGSEIHTIYTGLVKLLAFIKTEDEESDRANYIIVREFPEKIDVTSVKTFTIITNYTKIDSDEVTSLLGSYGQTYDNKLLGQVTLLIDDISKFSQSFISTINSDYNNFEIGFGIPYGGYYIADKMSPSKLGVFDNVEVNLSFTKISISSPTFSYNTDIIRMPDKVRDMTRLRVEETNPSVDIYDSLLYMGVEKKEDNFTQIPITFEGINQSPGIDLGTCDDMHVVWQSNRSKYWDIFYSNSVNKLSPFRFNTQITNTKSNSLRPSVSVNRNGSRMAVWHDNRNGNYDILAARAIEGYTCDKDKCSREMADAFDTSIIECNISIEYDAVVGTYSLSLSFYRDVVLTDLYVTIEMNNETYQRWFIDNTVVTGSLVYDDIGEITGVSFSTEGIVTITYTPDKDDDIFDKVLYVKLNSVEVTE